MADKAHRLTDEKLEEMRNQQNNEQFPNGKQLEE